jgi:transcriptional regulator with XRE-family HTH domain
MATRERAADFGARSVRKTLRTIGEELRARRVQLGLSQRTVAEATGCSHTQIWRIEKGDYLSVAFRDLVVLAAVLGLDLSARCYPHGHPLRDAAHRALLERLRRLVGPSWTWRTEVPFPGVDDRRAWDALLTGPARIGVEGETRPTDGQDLERRVNLKARDGGVDHVILLLSDSRHNRSLVREHDLKIGDSPLVPRRALIAALAEGRDPRGNAILLL